MKRFLLDHLVDAFFCITFAVAIAILTGIFLPPAFAGASAICAGIAAAMTRWA